jgi:hypothetical protein
MITAWILTKLQPVTDLIFKRFSKKYLDRPNLYIEIERADLSAFAIDRMKEVINGVPVYTSMRSWNYRIKVYNHSEFPAIGLSFNSLTDDPDVKLNPPLTINSRIDPVNRQEFSVVFEKKVVGNEPLPDDYFNKQMEEYKRQIFTLSYMNIHRTKFYTVHNENLPEGQRDSFPRRKPSA